MEVNGYQNCLGSDILQNVQTWKDNEVKNDDRIVIYAWTLPLIELTCKLPEMLTQCITI